MRSRVRASVVVASLAVTGTAARADVCDDLSYRRNAIYKAAGYCFKTAAQIRNFGNAGCVYDNQADVPLSQRERQIVGDLVRRERSFGCR